MYESILELQSRGWQCCEETKKNGPEHKQMQVSS
jgi:hypothetical protein